MRALSEAEFIALWEHGRRLYPCDLGALAIRIASPEVQSDKVVDWPLGRRNRALLELRSACFGPALRGWLECRHCAEKLEFELNVDSLAASPPSSLEEPILVNGRSFRLPTSRDLASVAGSDPAEAALQIAQCCRLDSGPELIADDLEAIGKQMALTDPLADITVHFDCPVCRESFDESLDLPRFLFAEVEGRAKRVLLEVNALASAYGWSETEILSLSSARRASYLEMVGT